MKRLSLALAFVAFQGYAQDYSKERDSRSLLRFEASPIAETEPVISAEDAADDTCIYVPLADDEPIWIVGTDKKRGLEVYDLRGRRAFAYDFGRINNVDVVELDLPLIVGSNRTHNSIDVYRLFADGSLRLLQRTATRLKDVYGITAEKHKEGAIVFVSDKKGRVHEFMLKLEKSTEIDLTLVRQFKFRSTVEGLDVDSYYNRLYVAEEDKGLWILDLEAERPMRTRKMALKTDKTTFIPDFEGVALAEEKDGKGHVFISIQGANEYAILDRETLNILGIFSILDSQNQRKSSVEETDGIEVSTHPRARLFIAQDGHNQPYNQNFKILSLDQILFNINQQ